MCVAAYMVCASFRTNNLDDESTSLSVGEITNVTHLDGCTFQSKPNPLHKIVRTTSDANEVSIISGGVDMGTKDDPAEVNVGETSEESTPSSLTDDLLPGWKATCTHDGQMYYYNEETLVTSWVRPSKTNSSNR